MFFLFFNFYFFCFLFFFLFFFFFAELQTTTFPPKNTPLLNPVSLITQHFLLPIIPFIPVVFLKKNPPVINRAAPVTHSRLHCTIKKRAPNKMPCPSPTRIAFFFSSSSSFLLLFLFSRLAFCLWAVIKSKWQQP